jgi:hypothetical protein
MPLDWPWWDLQPKAIATFVTVQYWISFFMSPLIFHFFLAVIIYMLLFHDIPFFQNVLPLYKSNSAVFHLHKQLSYSMHISCYNIVYWQTEKSLALVADQKLATFEGLFILASDILYMWSFLSYALCTSVCHCQTSQFLFNSDFVHQDNIYPSSIC